MHVLMVIALVIGMLVFVGGLVVALSTPESRPGSVVTTVVAAFVMVFAFFGSTYHSVDAGHVGLVKAFGAYTGVKEAGAVFTWPWETVEEARIRNASHEIRMDGQVGNGSAASKESQEVFVVATLNYSLEQGCVQDLYTNYGAGYFETIIEPRTKQIFKAESVRYSAVDILPNREKIRRETQGELEKQLQPYCVRGLDFLLTNVGFGQEFTQAIEEKQVATQQAAAEQNRVQIAKQQAQQKVETAKGEARATRVQARADAYANRLRSRNLTPTLVEWERIQKWQPDVIYLPSDAVVVTKGALGK